MEGSFGSWRSEGVRRGRVDRVEGEEENKKGGQKPGIHRPRLEL